MVEKSECQTYLQKMMQIRQKKIQANLTYIDHLQDTRKFCKRPNNTVRGRKRHLILN